MAGARPRKARNNSPLRPHGGEFALEMLDAVDEAGSKLVDFADCLDVGKALEQLSKHDADFAAGQMCAETEVWSGAAVADVLTCIAGHVEPISVFENAEV